MADARTNDGPPWMSEYARVRAPMFMVNDSPGGLVPENAVQASFDALSWTATRRARKLPTVCCVSC
jgi:hypothetical protein